MEAKIDSIFDPSVAEIIERTSLERRLASGDKLVVKLGVDPTSKDLHLGHAVVLRKLKQFQELGHRVVLVIGDFTAMIGDPSGRNTSRPVLTSKEVKENMKTYVDQAKLILNLDKVDIVYNSKWLGPMKLSDLLSVASLVSVNSLLEREDFSKRIAGNQPLGLHELLYPVSQALDSIELKADIELGGWDQRLNLLMGRELQKKMNQKPQEVVIMHPLIGLDGERKMSKSLGNYIGISESPDQMFGKLMSVTDELIEDYATLAAGLTLEEVGNLPNHPRDAKAVVAQKIVEIYHGLDKAKKASDNFQRVFRDKEGAEGLAKKVPLGTGDLSLVSAVRQAAEISGSEALRLVGQKAVKLNGKVIDDPTHSVKIDAKGQTLQVGKHRFYNLVSGSTK